MSQREQQKQLQWIFFLCFEHRSMEKSILPKKKIFESLYFHNKAILGGLYIFIAVRKVITKYLNMMKVRVPTTKYLLRVQVNFTSFMYLR